MMNTTAIAWIGRLIAFFALLAFLFMPQFSCGGLQVKGYDIIAKQGFMTEVDDATLSGISWGIVCVAIAGILFASGGHILFGIAGVILSVILILYVKDKVSQDPMTAGVIKFEPGAFITIIAFIALFIAGLTQRHREPLDTLIHTKKGQWSP